LAVANCRWQRSEDSEPSAAGSQAMSPTATSVEAGDWSYGQALPG